MIHACPNSGEGMIASDVESTLGSFQRVRVPGAAQHEVRVAEPGPITFGQLVRTAITALSYERAAAEGAAAALESYLRELHALCVTFQSEGRLRALYAESVMAFIGLHSLRSREATLAARAPLDALKRLANESGDGSLRLYWVQGIGKLISEYDLGMPGDLQQELTDFASEHQSDPAVWKAFIDASERYVIRLGRARLADALKKVAGLRTLAHNNPGEPALRQVGKGASQSRFSKRPGGT